MTDDLEAQYIIDCRNEEMAMAKKHLTKAKQHQKALEDHRWGRAE